MLNNARRFGRFAVPLPSIDASWAPGSGRVAGCAIRNMHARQSKAGIPIDRIGDNTGPRPLELIAEV
jgi:hypothetical protein